MKKIVEISLLFDFYGELLTKKQIQIFELYYNHDLSLGEISEELKISRQGVYDSLKRGETLLYKYEEKLKLVEKFIKQKDALCQILDIIEEIEKNQKIEILKEAIIKIKNISSIAAENS